MEKKDILRKTNALTIVDSLHENSVMVYKFKMIGLYPQEYVALKDLEILDLQVTIIMVKKEDVT
jgi:hypothetical protein